MRFHNILAKIAPGLVAAAVFLFAISGAVSAQENSGVFAKHELNLLIQSDLTASAIYNVELTNNNDSPLSSFAIQVPFSGVSAVNFQVDGHPEQLTTLSISGGTSFTANFPGEAVISRTTKRLTFTFNIAKVAESEWGMTQIYIGKVQADQIVTDFHLNITYPASLGAIQYTSSPNLSGILGQVKLAGVNGHLVQWGDRMAAQIQEIVPVDQRQGQDNVLFNLPQSGAYQKLQYTDVVNLQTAVVDRIHNLWGIAKQANAQAAVSYSVNWQNEPIRLIDPQLFPMIDYGGSDLPLPEALSSLPAETSVRDKLQKLYDYMLHAYSAAQPVAGTTTDISQPISNYLQGDNRPLNDMEFARVTAALCQRLGMQCNVVYGYLAGPGFGRVDPTLPHVWVEALTPDNQLVTLDPYLQITSDGFYFFDVSNFGRLRMGVWDPRLVQDSLLGLVTGAARPRPAFIALKNPLPTDKEYTYNFYSFFPATVRGGEFYVGYLTFESDSPEFIDIKGIIFAGQDLTSQLLQVTPQLRRVMIPFTQNRMYIDWQHEPNLLADKVDILHSQLVPQSDLIPILTTDRAITFVPNTGALVAIFALIVLMILGIVVWGVKIWFDQEKVKLRLKQKYRQKKTSQQTPVNGHAPAKLPFPPHRQVHKLEDRS